MPVTVVVDIEEASEFLRFLHRDQVPFATSQAINATALQVQERIRASLDDSFTIRRRDWARRNIYMGREDFATKNRLQARVSVRAPGSGDRSDILAKFEEGGVKKPQGSRLAIPQDGLKRAASGVVPRSARPKAFNFQLHRKGTVFRGKGRNAVGTSVYVGEKNTFMILRQDGTGGIYQRVGMKVGRKRVGGRRLASDVATRRVRDLNVRTLYRFTPQAHVDSRLHFEETAKGVVRVRFSQNFDEAFAKAVLGGRGSKGKDGTTQLSAGAKRMAKADVSGLGRVGRRRSR